MPTYLEVAFPIPLVKTFHYEALEQNPAVPVGCRVAAPFGRKSAVGYVVATTTETPAFQTKRITCWLDEEPLIDAAMLDLGRWMADRYLCSLGEALACMVPAGLAAPKRPRAEAKEEPLPIKVVKPFELSGEQVQGSEQFAAAVDAKKFRAFVLRGITDSGKTELYLRTIDRILALKRQALYLLPEIVLTPPFIEQLRHRYGRERVGLWHSGLSAARRYQVWKGLHDGSLLVLLGARSAVFAPFKDLGLIIVDEEHEPSYKQEDRPRYHARDVALERARRCGAVVIMGSATPSLESYARAKRGEFTLVEMTSRVKNRELPPITLVDRRAPTPVEGEAPKRRRGVPFSIFSGPLKFAMEQSLARREQIMLFVNRRGFTPFLRCSACGWVARCPRCSTTLSLHMKERKHPLAKTKSGVLPVPADAQLQCHTCPRVEPVPIQCPGCKRMKLHQFGIGTQRVEEEVKALFPFVKLARLDRDLNGARHAYEKIYRAFAKRELDVLVGTQMIAKGFDFPSVTLVGVVDADVTLYLPDFRSAERTFQLIAQVAGRTGRGDSGGQVLVQTHHADHYAFQAAQGHDYLRFYEEEIGHREALRYPPFCRLVNIVLRATKETQALAAAEALAETMPVRNGTELLGPAPASYSRVRNQYRYQLILKGNDASLKTALEFLRSYRPAKAFMSVDVDPVDLL